MTTDAAGITRNARGPRRRSVPDGENEFLLEQFTFRCSDPTVAEDKLGKEAEAGDALASSMQADAAQRHRRQAGCYI